jgi:hypothetical protein
MKIASWMMVAIWVKAGSSMSPPAPVKIPPISAAAMTVATRPIPIAAKPYQTGQRGHALAPSGSSGGSGGSG